MARMDPLENKLVVLIGGSGFIGKHIAQDLLERGARVRIAGRRPEAAFRLKPLANLGQIQFVRMDAGDDRSIAAAMAGADAAVYLIGTFADRQERLQAKAAGIAAQAAADQGAGAFVYVSSIGADAESDSGYASSKAHGEALVRDAFANATVIRPSLVFGEEGGFLPMFADLVATAPVMPVFAPESKVQPVWVDDLAKGIGNALADPGAHGGKTYEAAGPNALTMLALHQDIAEAQQRDRTLLPMPDFAASIFAALPFSPMNSDQLTMLRHGSVASGEFKGLTALGVEPKPLSLFLERWMVRYRKHGRFAVRRDAPGRMA